MGRFSLVRCEAAFQEGLERYIGHGRRPDALCRRRDLHLMMTVLLHFVVPLRALSGVETTGQK